MVLLVLNILFRNELKKIDLGQGQSSSFNFGLMIHLSKTAQTVPATGSPTDDIY